MTSSVVNCVTVSSSYLQECKINHLIGLEDAIVETQEEYDYISCLKYDLSKSEYILWNYSGSPNSLVIRLNLEVNDFFN